MIGHSQFDRAVVSTHLDRNGRSAVAQGVLDEVAQQPRNETVVADDRRRLSRDGHLMPGGLLGG
jgi:hypothetical protein